MGSRRRLTVGRGKKGLLKQAKGDYSERSLERVLYPIKVQLSVCGKWNGLDECNICGGSIVSNRFIVTAAHCIPENPRGSVALGAHEISIGGKKQITVARFQQHPSWNFPSKFDNDIAVLELDEEIKFSEFMSPICLPEPSVCFTEGTPCVVTGWGLTSEHSTGYIDTLQEVAVKLIDREKCRQYSGYKDLTDQMQCAGYESGGKDACGGDSGGPLVCRSGKNGAWVLYGIVSWGYGCARPGNPGVYAFVPALVEWVKEVTGLKPVIKMDKCYDGVINKRVPIPTRVPTKNEIAKSNHRELHPTLFKCDNPAGSGQFHTDSGVFQTGGYPKPYSHNQHCYFCVSPDRPGNFVEISINEIQLDQKKNCHRKGDYVFVEPANKEGYYLCQVKRNPKDVHTIINSDTICLRFVSNASKSRAGLSATYKQILSPPSGCGGDQIIHLKENSEQRTIKSMNYPEKYPDRVQEQCSWLLRTDENGRFKIMIDFLVLQMEKQDKTKKESFFCQDSDQIIVYGSASCEECSLQTQKNNRIRNPSILGPDKNESEKICVEILESF